MKKMKKGFSLLELIFAIVVIGIIASFAIPKYLDTKDSAMASTIKRDIATATTSIKSHYLVNGDIAKISDAIALNETHWGIEDSKITYKDNGKDCVSLEVKDNSGTKTLELTVDSTATNGICKILTADGIKSTIYNLY